MKKFFLIALSLLLVTPAAAQTTINNLGAGAAVTDTDLLAAYQGSNPAKKITGAQLKLYSQQTAVRKTTTTSEAMADTDRNKLVTFDNTSPVACTIAQAGSGGLFDSTWAGSILNVGTGTVTCTAQGTSVFFGASSGTTLTLTAGQGCDLYSDGSTGYRAQCGKGLISFSVAGTSALGTGAISSATCATVVTTPATGVATTDVVLASFNGDPTAVTGYVPLTSGMLTIIAYPTANNVNFKVCNNTSGSITPGAITLNWKVVR